VFNDILRLAFVKYGVYWRRRDNCRHDTRRRFVAIGRWCSEASISFICRASRRSASVFQRCVQCHPEAPRR
jgi:hypothetical protein